MEDASERNAQIVREDLSWFKYWIFMCSVLSVLDLTNYFYISRGGGISPQKVVVIWQLPGVIHYSIFWRRRLSATQSVYWYTHMISLSVASPSSVYRSLSLSLTHSVTLSLPPYLSCSIRGCPVPWLTSRNLKWSHVTVYDRGPWPILSYAFWSW